MKVSPDPMLQRIKCEWEFIEYESLSSGDYIKMEIIPQNQLGETRMELGIIDKEIGRIETISGNVVDITSFRYDICLFYRLGVKNKDSLKFVNFEELT
jgi:hypothetical protein